MQADDQRPTQKDTSDQIVTACIRVTSFRISAKANRQLRRALAEMRMTRWRHQLRSKLVLFGGIITAVSLLCTAVPFASAQPATPDRDSPRPQASGDRSPASLADAWDANRDGVYTCDEWKGYLGRWFDRADRNHDGNLTPAEFETMRHAASALADADFGYFDENQDGKITRKELVEKPNEFILRFDKNGDCRVTPEELKDTPTEQKRPSGKGKRS
jgi:hypothetical protein